jgi:hypothetical protein
VQRQAQLEAVAASELDQLVLDRTEAGEGLQLKLAELARDLALTEIRRLPAVRCRCSSPAQGQTRYASRNRTAMLVKSTAYRTAPAALLAILTVSFGSENKGTPRSVATA